MGVGVGGFKQSEIDTIAGASDRALTVSDYASLGTLLDKLVSVIEQTTSSGLEGDVD